jgi:5'-methylthioadenosine phosphorylase
MPQIRIGVIGGTGLYQIKELKDVHYLNVDTPFGKPSDSIITGTLEGVGIAFLPRHARGHRILPAELPSRANIYALKSLGVEFIIAVCSAGSFKDEIEPGHILIPDQIIDRTSGRISTFFGNGIAAHIPFAEPFCPILNKILINNGHNAGATIHPKGTFVAMEGPAFSTRAESILYKTWGADIIGMTVLPEAKLAREAEICYSVIGCVTDYDSWHIHRDIVTAETVIETLNANIDLAKNIIKQTVTQLPLERHCNCVDALKTAFITDPDMINQEQKRKLNLLINKYIQ